ncbi:MAG: adenosylcobinamide-GDP ribazoletransferase [Candidatus Polarisedimenticolaceae bacterium]|nr:adenosylcobinamide-GDP ribazoletransferase [Candidatus Polarisedimenticolaceae bacterium]
MIKPFLYALQFLTRIPVPLMDAPSPTMQGRAVLAYPLVGLLIGSLLVVTHLTLSSQHISTSLQAALLLAFWVGITGALHIDGLADMTDAWVGGYGDRERTLEIMKEPTCGPMAVTIIVVVLLIKYAAIEQLVELGYWQALLVVPILGRASLVASLLALPYIRKEGLGSHAAQHLSKQGAWLALMLTAIFVATQLGATLLPLLAALFALFWLFSRSVMRRIGGLTGDVAGALCELVEMFSLLMIVLLIS